MPDGGTDGRTDLL